MAEKKECRTVSNMSVPELAALWSEYMRKLGKCLLALQHDQHGGARPLLDLWVAEAIALICCVRVYSPEFLKVIDSSAMDGSQNTRLSKPALEQHMELLELSLDQIRDGLYIRRIAAARAAELELQRHEAAAQVLPAATSSGRQHPSDHLANAHAVAEKMKIIGAEEYKLHGIVTDALFNGVFTSLQDAMGLVHMYPFLPDAMEYLDCIASLQGPPSAPQPAVTQADWDTLLAYCAKVTAADHFHYVPLLRSTQPPGQATPTAVSPTHMMVVASQMPSSVQKSVHFSPSSGLMQPQHPVSSSVGHSYSGSYTVEHMTSAYSHSALLNSRLQSDASQALPSLGMVQSVEGAGQMSRQMSHQGSNRLTLNHTTEAPVGWVPQGQASQHLSVPAGQDDAPGHLSGYSQHQLTGPLHAAEPFSAHRPALNGHSYGPNHATAASFPTTANSFRPLHLQQAQFVQVEGGQVLVSRAPVQALNPGAPVQGFVGQGVVHHQGRVIQGQGPDHLPAWLGQNLAYTHGSPVVQSAPQGQAYSPMQTQAASQFAQSPDPKAVYPTAAMRSQQLTSVQTHHAQPAGSVQAPLAPFLNEQLKRMLAEGGPSGRRGF